MTEVENLKFKWFAVHVYAGFEGRVGEAILETAIKKNLKASFGEIMIPEEVVEEVKSGIKKTQRRRCFPGYILIQMDFNNLTANLVRGLPKVTGFLCNSKKPVPLSPEEVERMLALVNEKQKVRSKVEFSEGDRVKVIDGPFANFNGSIEELKPDKQKLRVLVSIFGRATPVELDYSQVETIA